MEIILILAYRDFILLSLFVSGVITTVGLFILSRRRKKQVEGYVIQKPPIIKSFLKILGSVLMFVALSYFISICLIAFNS